MHVADVLIVWVIMLMSQRIGHWDSVTCLDSYNIALYYTVTEYTA